MAVSAVDSGSLEKAVVAGSGPGLQVVAFIEVLLLAVWLGSMIFFSFAVAPSAFAVLPSRHLAGLMVTASIMKIEMLGLIIGPLLILIQAATWQSRGASSQSKALRLILLAVMIAAAGLSRFWVTATMSALRNAMGGIIDEVSTADPLRVQFNDLHHYSVALMTVAMLAGLGVLFITVRSWLTR